MPHAHYPGFRRTGAAAALAIGVASAVLERTRARADLAPTSYGSFLFLATAESAP